MSNYLPEDKIKHLRNLYLMGRTLRMAEKWSGVSKVTVLRYYKQFREELGIPKCPCGKPMHKGWCTWRLQQSSARINFLRKWGKTLDWKFHKGTSLPPKRAVYNRNYVSRMVSLSKFRKQKERIKWLEAKKELAKVQKWLKDNRLP